MFRLSGNLRASTSWNPQCLFRPVQRLLYLRHHQTSNWLMFRKNIRHNTQWRIGFCKTQNTGSIVTVLQRDSSVYVPARLQSEVYRMGRLLVIGTKALVKKFTSWVDFTDIPSQWTLGYVELRVKKANQRHFVSKVKQETPELYFHTETNSHRLLFKGLLFDVEYIYGFVWWGVCKQSR